jgi:prephenate dehydrogenase
LTRPALDIAARRRFMGAMFDRIAILAPGLLGGSVALASQHYGVAKSVALWSRRPEARHRFSQIPWVGAVTDSPEAAVRGAQLVVVAAPVDVIVPLLRQIAPALEPGAIVTDVGSVKGDICRFGSEAIRGRAHFVGSHPMAGSEKTGWAHARAEMFVGRTVFVTPVAESDPAAVDALVKFWSAFEASVATLTPDQHDEIVAHISHVPQLLASALCAALAKRPAAWRNHAGPGLRDTTRIAGSDARLWKTILEQNRDEVLRALRHTQDELHGVERALANRDWFELQAILERGKAYRDQFRPIP